MTARSAVTSSPPMASTTRAVFEALGMTSKRSSSTHHTMMSSSTEASASVEQVGVLRAPGGDLAQVVGEGRLQAVEGAGARDPHGAQVADVEHRRRAARPVLGERARRVLDRHLPAPEGDHLAPRARWRLSSGEVCSVTGAEASAAPPARRPGGTELVGPAAAVAAAVVGQVGGVAGAGAAAGSGGNSSTIAASTWLWTPSRASRLSTPWPW